MSDGRDGPEAAQPRISEEAVDRAFRSFVTDSRFPCLGGRSVVRHRTYRLGVYGELGSAPSADPLSRDLVAFVRTASVDDPLLRAFVAVFPDRPPVTEHDFEQRLWMQLQQLHERDDPSVGWDPAASADPGNVHFSFSFAGHAFFIVGLHARSSRKARSFRWPALVFNPRAQFDRLRADGRYARYQALIRARDVALQGSLNPNLADFGERSEARQYSGRGTESDWRCPFHRRIP